jgi:hypothetical protein
LGVPPEAAPADRQLQALVRRRLGQLANSARVEYRRVTSSSKKIVEDLVRHNEVSDWSSGGYGLREIDVMWWLPLPKAVSLTATEGWFGNCEPVHASNITGQTGAVLHLLPSDAILSRSSDRACPRWRRDWIEASQYEK